jgi:hypothetical protein
MSKIMDHTLECTADAVGKMAKTVLSPVGGPEACLDAYEAGIRATTDAQLRIARVVNVEPVRSIVASYANLTRDIGATNLSRARWFLDL